MENISISAASWLPLSAIYPYDDNISLQPELTIWSDGYGFFYHPIFENTKDVTINKQTAFYLTSASSLLDVIREQPRTTANIGSYIALQLDGLYLTTDTQTNTLYLSNTFLRKENYYRIFINTDGTYSFMQGDSLYVTVESTLPYNLYLTTQLDVDSIDRQKFFIYTPNNKDLYITTHFVSPTNIEPTYIERFVSYSKKTNAVRAIGIVFDDDYNMHNDYMFTAVGFDISFPITGLVRDQTWVHYYNDLVNNIFNSGVELYNIRCISGVKVNKLVDLPYLSQVDLTNSTMKVNFANLKNVLTPEYEYNIKSSGVSAFE